MNRNILNDLLNTRGHINEDELNAYLDGSAPSDVRHKVENTMLNSELFSDAIEGYQEMGMETVPSLEDFSEFKKKLPASEGAKIIQMSPVQKTMRALIAVAAVVLIGLFAYNAIQSPTPASLYSDFYTHYENDISLTRRGAADGMNKDFKSALGQYAVGEFSAAVPNFEKALSTEPANDAAHFFAGIALLETNRNKEAIQHLSIVKNNNTTYSRKAYWYAILANLKLGDMDKAKEMLSDFAKTPGFKSTEAKKLMSAF